MADVNVAVEESLTPTSASAVTIDRSGFGNPLAAIVLCSNGRTEDVTQTTMRLSIGFTDFTNSNVVTGTSDDNAGTSNTGGGQNNNGDVALSITGGFGVGEVGVENNVTTDGMSIDFTTAQTAQRSLAVAMFNGSDISNQVVGQHTMDNTTGANNVDIGFVPDVVLFTTARLR